MNTKPLMTLILIVEILVGYGFGYGVGFTKGGLVAMEFGLKLADEFIDTIDFDEEAIAAGIFNYQNRISGCFDRPNLTTNGN